MRDGIAQISPDLLGNDLDDETKKFKPKANPGVLFGIQKERSDCVRGRRERLHIANGKK